MAHSRQFIKIEEHLLGAGSIRPSALCLYSGPVMC